jgi:hypothetical protein
MMLLVFKGRKEENRKERRDSRERERQRGRLSPLYGTQLHPPCSWTCTAEEKSQQGSSAKQFFSIGFTH